MATGRGNYLTKQTGEYLVAAELSRRGFIATTFTGNVPHYDIVAVDDSGGHALVQVKAIAANSWQLNAAQFVEVVFEGPRQIVKGALREPYPDLVCVFVQIAKPDSGIRDRFFVLPWKELCQIVVAHHCDFLGKHGGIRPRKPESLHTAISPKQIEKWEGRWDVLKAQVRPVPANKALQAGSRARRGARSKRPESAARG
jgi:hypothetical protein